VLTVAQVRHLSATQCGQHSVIVGTDLGLRLASHKDDDCRFCLISWTRPSIDEVPW